MRKSRVVSLVVSVGVVASGFVGVSSSVSAAVISTPSPVSVVAADPSVVAFDTFGWNLMKGDFYMLGGSDSGNGRGTEEIARMGSTIRLSQYEPDKYRSYIEYSDGKNRCARYSSARYGNSPAGDRSAPWTCMKGASTLIVKEMNALTPIGYMTVVNAGADNKALFTSDDTLPSFLTIAISGPDGVPVQRVEYGMNLPDASFVYSVRITNLSSSTGAFYSIKTGSQGIVIPFNKLRNKKYVK